MSATISSIVFDDIFTISDIDKEGIKFDRGPMSPVQSLDEIKYLPKRLTSCLSVPIIRPLEEL